MAPFLLEFELQVNILRWRQDQGAELHMKLLDDNQLLGRAYLVSSDRGMPELPRVANDESPRIDARLGAVSYRSSICPLTSSQCPSEITILISQPNVDLERTLNEILWHPYGLKESDRLPISYYTKAPETPCGEEKCSTSNQSRVVIQTNLCT